MSVEILLYHDGHLIKRKLFFKVPLVIGKSPSCDFSIKDCDNLSDCQFAILKENEDYFLVDSNLTFFHEKKKIDPVMPIEVGRFQLHISIKKNETQKNEIIKEFPSSQSPLIKEKIYPLSKNFFGLGKIKLYPPIFPQSIHDLEVRIKWNDIDYNVRVFQRGEKIIIGPKCDSYGIAIPTLENDIILGDFTNKKVYLNIPEPFSFQITGPADPIKGQSDISQSQSFVLHSKSECVIDIGNNIKIHINYIPATPRFISKFLTAIDLKFTETIIWSGLGHGLIAAIIIFIMVNTPKENIPKLENVPSRFAKLLIKPPVEIKKPEPKKIVQQEKIKLPPKPEKVIIQSHKIKEINKYPLKLKSRKVAVQPANIKGVSKSQKVSEIGALGALGAIQMNQASLSPTPFSINVNSDAGGAKGFNPTGIVGLLKSEGGKLSLGGMSEVKTKGYGYGSGTGYGVNGLKGHGSGKAIAGVVIGVPKLMKMKEEEGLTRKVVMAVVQKHLGEIQQCYERSLLSNPNLAGRMEYEWLINPNGIVSDVRVTQTDMGQADQLKGCVFKVFAKMKFPKAQNGQNTEPKIGFPFGQL